MDYHKWLSQNQKNLNDATGELDTTPTESIKEVAVAAFTVIGDFNGDGEP